MSDINFKAFTADVFDANGNKIDPNIGRGVYRDDTGELMSICGPNFVPVQHGDVVNPVLDILDGTGYEIMEREADKRSLYDIQGRKGAFVSTKLVDGGAVMRTEIILGDFIRPTGHSSYLDQGEDTNFFKVSLLNSHNSKYAVKANTSYLRLVCMNGMTQPKFSAGAYGKHTQSFNLDAMQAQIGNAFEAMGDDADRFGLWASTKIDAMQAEMMLKQTIAKLPNKANGTPHFSEPLVNKILTRFKVEDQTVWGLYNAVTWWQTHSDFRANSNLVTSMTGRESKVASMLNSNPWKSFIKEAA